MAAAKDKTVSVWGDKVHPKVRILGDGPRTKIASNGVHSAAR